MNTLVGDIIVIKCKHCSKELPATLEYFYKREANTRNHMLDTRCKDCVNAHRRTTRDKTKYNAYQAEYTRKLRIETLSVYSNGVIACACCGTQHIEFLCLDHIAGGGKAHRKQLSKNSRCGPNTLFWALKRDNYPPGYRVLCLNCNHALGVYNYCPHTRVAVAI